MAQETTAETGTGFGLETETLTTVHWVAVVLAGVTGTIHLYLFFTEDFLPFVLAGLGFFGAIVLLLVNFHRKLLYVVGVFYTLAQIVGYLMLPLGPLWLGVVDKVTQVVLIALLIYLWRTDDAASY